MRILAILFVILATACSSTKKVQKNLDLNPSDAITLERTGCYGTCPIYSLTIYGDGKVTYEGKRHVDNIGEFTGQLSQAQLTSLYTYAKGLDWERYPEKFPIDNVDFPQFNLAFINGKHSYATKANSRADEELITLSKLMDELAKEITLKELN